MFSEILICSDGSDPALQAGKAAAEIALRLQAKLTLVSVFNPASLLAPFAMAPEAAPPVEALVTLGKQIHAAVQEKTGAVLDAAGVAFQSRHVMGHPVDCILETAQSLKADLIVLGSRGVSHWKALLLGSVSEGVLHHAPCSVLIVRGEQPTFPRILLASDGSEGAYQATLAASTLARKFAVPLTILNVVEPIGMLAHVIQGEARSDAYLLRAKEIAAKRIRDMAEQADCAYTLHQEVGHPAETIVRYAEENQYPLVVVGSTGISALPLLPVGSVANRVARHAQGSVLMVRSSAVAKHP